MSEPKTLDLFRLDERVAIVTGGSKGLGKAIGLGLAEAGATVVYASRDQAACEAAAADNQAHCGRAGLCLAVDVTSPDSVAAMVAEVQERCGRIDILVNSAGINIRHPIEEFSPADYRQVVETNLTGSWLCCRAVAPLLKAQRRGAVINLGSALGAVGLAERSAYCSSKAAIGGLTRALALEWAPYGVRCNAICPGPFLTEMNRPLLAQPEKARGLLERTALNRWAELHEIRGAALFLASDAASYVTGTELFVDGGWTAQ
ncbi:MAG: SDR family oxidoreductase [Armatimonadetes bacterium]|nr:SDR family oxidoreductase [Armatimonadota bacterium]